MLGKIRRNLRRLATNKSGNAMILVAVGMPALIGGAGLAVDTAQWYMWKREMQYAADQAALAGAWSLVAGSTGDTYKTRAQQELSTNLQVVNFTGTPTIQKANYAGGTNNSVVVSFSASKALPFSSMLMQHGVTVSVSAQAVYEQGRSFTSCLIAVDPTTRGAITVGGNAYVVAGCGAAALSNNQDAVVLNGGATFQVGWIVSEGGIDQALADQGNELYQYQNGLSDPYASLTPPNNPTPQTYACTSGSTTYSATVNDTTTVTKMTYTSSNGSSWKLSTSVVQSTATQTKTMTVSKTTKVGDTVISSTSTQTGTVTSSNSGGKTTYTRADIVTTEVGKVTSIATVTTPGGANMQPGTYTDFQVSCDTTMAKGVYVIDGGTFSVNATDKLIGQGVMIVLKNGAGIKINGSSNVFLQAMTTDEMIQYGGMTEEQALKLKDMLVFEDRNSPGNNQDFINGTTGMILDGTFYFPSSTLTFDGSASVVSRCLVIAAKQIVIQGTAYMTSFCPSGVVNTVSVGGTTNSVKLVA